MESINLHKYKTLPLWVDFIMHNLLVIRISYIKKANRCSYHKLFSTIDVLYALIYYE